MANSDKKEDCKVLISNVANNPDLSLAETLYIGSQKYLKYTSLVTLTLQNAALSLTMRMVRTQKDLFITSTAVVMAEIMKLFACFAMVAIEERSMQKWYMAIKKSIFEQPWDTLKLAVPSLVYLLQNNLLYVGATHVDAATCQVTYQLKILTTAVFSVLMLGKRLHYKQWIALFILFTGVAFVQFAQFSAPATPTVHIQRPLVGFLAIVLACCLSGFAGVYFEKILKGNSDVSLWIRNIQLCIFSIPIGFFTVYIFEREDSIGKGFFYGYNYIVWVVIFLQAIGGLIVAVVVKFADNILKGFSTSMAIVLSCIISIYAFKFQLTTKFIIGTVLVISSIFLYSRPHPTTYKK